MNAMVLASALIKARSDAPRLGQRELELSYSGLRHGLGDIARVVTALVASRSTAGCWACSAAKPPALDSILKPDPG